MSERLESRRSEIAAILGALDRLERTEEWAVLKEKVFDVQLASIRSRMYQESTKTEIDVHRMYRLQGEEAVARRHADLKGMARNLAAELENINKNIKT